MVQLSHPYLTPGKTIGLTRPTFLQAGKSLNGLDLVYGARPEQGWLGVQRQHCLSQAHAAESLVLGVRVLSQAPNPVNSSSTVTIGLPKLKNLVRRQPQRAPEPRRVLFLVWGSRLLN